VVPPSTGQQRRHGRVDSLPGTRDYPACRGWRRTAQDAGRARGEVDGSGSRVVKKSTGKEGMDRRLHGSQHTAVTGRDVYENGAYEGMNEQRHD